MENTHDHQHQHHAQDQPAHGKHGSAQSGHGRKHEGHDSHDQSHSHGHHDHHDHHAMMIKDFKKRFWISLLITVPIVVLAPMIQDFLGYRLRFEGLGYVQFLLSTAIFFYGGWPFLTGLISEIKQKAPGMMTLIALAISVAYFYSSAVVFGLEGKVFFWELATLIALMLLGHWIEMKSVMGASRALQELAELMPSSARLLRENGEQEEVSLTDLQPGDLILVKPGEKIPADGTVQEGASHVNESMVTGESRPVAKGEQDEVIGGSVNDKGTLKIKVSQTGEDGYLAKVIAMVEEAQKTKSKTQNLADRAAAWLFYLALAAGITTLVVWLGLGRNFEYALERMVTVMIISCPHALGLAIPLVVSISTAVSARNGLLIRNRSAFENARKINTIIFDKTGTLTQGTFGLSRYQSVSKDLSDQNLLRMAASLENSSEHPIAAGIVRKAQEEGLQLEEVQDFENITGKGIQANLKGQQVKVVSPGMLDELGIETPDKAFQNDDETVVFLLVEGELKGYLALADEIRPEAQAALDTLRSRGLKIMMATGDNQRVAQSVSDQLGLDRFYAEVLPEDKQEIIKKLQKEGAFVAMTGDGVNDAPALAQANVGIAVGSGTAVAAETADIVLVNSNPKDIANLILFGAATYRKMMQNLWWAAGYNIVAVPLAAGVLAGVGVILSPAVGAVLMSLSTIIVALNAQLLKRQIHKV